MLPFPFPAPRCLAFHDGRTLFSDNTDHLLQFFVFLMQIFIFEFSLNPS